MWSCHNVLCSHNLSTSGTRTAGAVSQDKPFPPLSCLSQGCCRGDRKMSGVMCNTVNFRTRKFFKGKDEEHFVIHQDKTRAEEMSQRLRFGSCRGPQFGSQYPYWTAHSSFFHKHLRIHAIQTDKQAYRDT